jgi:hypothetical protein
MSTSNRFAQFAPSRENAYYPGVFGWGFEVNGFRIVMYGPAEADHPAVKSFIARREKFTDSVDGIRIPDRVHRQYTSEKKQKKCLNAGEHGPCHVHVFDIKSGRETRFELVENYKPDEHFSMPLHLSEKRKNSLTDNQIKAVKPILNALVPDFIQCWREMYQNDRLSGYVSRMVKNGNHDMIETKQNDGSTKIYDPKSEAVAIVPMSAEISPISRRNLHRDSSGHGRQ